MTSDSIIAAVVAFLGGTGFNALLRFFSRNKNINLTTEALLRQEMTDRLDTMSMEIDELKKEVSFWRDQYLALYKDHADLRAQIGVIRNFDADDFSNGYPNLP
jgi:hypothetical protein